MFYRNLFIKYYAAAGEGEGAGGGGVEITPEIQALIDEQVATHVTGLKSKNSELLGKLKEQGDNLKRFEGIDPDVVRNILQRFSDDEEAKLIANGQIDEVLNKRTERMRTEFDKQVKEANERVNKAEAFSGKFRDRVLGDSIRAAALKAGAIPEGVEDLILRAKGLFQINEEGEAVAVDKDGNQLLGKDGKTPLSPFEWAESMKDTAPHLWPRAEGSGAGAHKNGGSNLKRSEMSQSQKNEFIRTNGQQAYLRLPK